MRIQVSTSYGEPTSQSRKTPTLIFSNSVHTGSLELARIGRALIDLQLTEVSRPGWWTLTGETIDLVHTGALVLARVGHALVKLYLTVGSSVAILQMKS